jgi:putative DNA primase/helicase
MAATSVTMVRGVNTNDREDDASRTSDVSGGAQDDLVDYLKACCADGAEGYVHVGVGYGPHINDKGKYGHKWFEPKVFHWPGEAEKAVEFILGASQNADVWVCPNLLLHDWIVEGGNKKTGRRKGDAVSLVTVHADIDGQVDIEKVTSIEGAFAVASGSPGHAHVYVPLSEPITGAQHDALSKALGAYLGNADVAKHSDNDLLRPPGTLNHKLAAAGGEPTPVVWQVKPSGPHVHPRVLAKILGVDLDAAETTDDTDRTKTTITTRGQGTASTLAKAEKFDLTAHPEVEAAIKRDSGDRSADTFGVVAACFGCGPNVGTDPLGGIQERSTGRAAR